MLFLFIFTCCGIFVFLFLYFLEKRKVNRALILAKSDNCIFISNLYARETELAPVRKIYHTTLTITLIIHPTYCILLKERLRSGSYYNPIIITYDINTTTKFEFLPCFKPTNIQILKNNELFLQLTNRAENKHIKEFTIPYLEEEHISTFNTFHSLTKNQL